MSTFKILSYSINTSWDSRPLDHAPIEIHLEGVNDAFVEMTVKGPFFDDPPAPSGPPGEPFWKLWDYEVAEAFFLGPNNRYLEVELSPHGQHLLLMLNGVHVDVGDCLPLDYKAKINGKTWEGKARIPAEYFPPDVNLFNAYAIHGSGDNRQYEALYPVPTGAFDQPDFHRLEYFQSIPFGTILPNNSGSELSKIWQDALDGKVHFNCTGK